MIGRCLCLYKGIDDSECLPAKLLRRRLIVHLHAGDCLASIADITNGKANAASFQVMAGPAPLAHADALAQAAKAAARPSAAIPPLFTAAAPSAVPPPLFTAALVAPLSFSKQPVAQRQKAEASVPAPPLAAQAQNTAAQQQLRRRNPPRSVGAAAITAAATAAQGAAAGTKETEADRSALQSQAGRKRGRTAAAFRAAGRGAAGAENARPDSDGKAPAEEPFLESPAKRPRRAAAASKEAPLISEPFSRATNAICQSKARMARRRGRPAAVQTITGAAASAASEGTFAVATAAQVLQNSRKRLRENASQPDLNAPMEIEPRAEVVCPMGPPKVRWKLSREAAAVTGGTENNSHSDACSRHAAQDGCHGSPKRLKHAATAGGSDVQLPEPSALCTGEWKVAHPHPQLPKRGRGRPRKMPVAEAFSKAASFANVMASPAESTAAAAAGSNHAGSVQAGAENRPAEAAMAASATAAARVRRSKRVQPCQLKET